MILALLLALGAAPVQDSRTTFVPDPVELLAGGREVPGRADVALERFGITYRFVDEASRERFRAEPARFEVALGGACARMGPLSGLGSAEIWTVHDGRLYFFASQACREGFLKRPEALIERDEAPPATGPAALEQGRRLVERALEALGGAEEVDSVASYRAVVERRSAADPDEVEQRLTRVWRFPDDLAEESVWPEYDSTYGWLTLGSETWATGRDVRRAHPSQALAFRRAMDRDLLVLLRSREAPGFVAVALEGGEEAGRAVDRLALFVHGATTVVSLDAATGAPVALTYRDRGPSSAFGEVVERLREPRRVGALLLPGAVEATFDGEPYPTRTRGYAALEVDVDVADSLLPPVR